MRAVKWVGLAWQAKRMESGLCPAQSKSPMGMYFLAQPGPSDLAKIGLFIFF